MSEPESNTVLFGMQAGDVRTRIADTVKQDDGTVLFYYEHGRPYRGMLAINRETYMPCLRKLECFVKHGHVLSVDTDGDEPVHFPGGVQLWPMFVELKGVPCAANLLVTGGPGEMTPYLFVNKAKRDNVLIWLISMSS